ncbi:MAG: hypothetical protein IJQ57_11970 [Synergistaceae bacterium]|nr:hypothetical protein [Synergistaceae bacterium]MBR0254056.1 hypothetical protein [Synergistaceae bacterium]
MNENLFSYHANASKRRKYFLKDKKAEIFEKVVTVDSIGARDLVYVPLFQNPVWVYARQVDADIFFRKEQYKIQETYFFVFNFYKNIKVGNAILYRDKWYEITRVDTDEDYNSDLFVYAKDIKTPPNAEKIKPYGWNENSPA